jgi:NAD+ diphosphatase
VRRCADAACNAEHFPRTDPAVIMLVTHEDHALLGRQRVWPAGMHSTLAGFVEPGESLEEAVAREVMEEAGVRVVDVRYHSSQPWPFPASIMLGFHARALRRDLAVDAEELETAGWFSRDFLSRAHDPEVFRLPRPDSIARRLIEDWLRGEA